MQCIPKKCVQYGFWCRGILRPLLSCPHLPLLLTLELIIGTTSLIIIIVIPTSSELLCKTHKIFQPGGKGTKITNPERGVEVCSCHCRQVGRQVEWLGGGDQNACMRSVSRVSLFRAKITRWARPASSLAPCHRLPLFAPTIHVARPLCLFDCLLLCLFVCLFVCLFASFFDFLAVSIGKLKSLRGGKPYCSSLPEEPKRS